MSKISEIEDYRIFTGPAELHKTVNTLKGIVAGITTDYQISEDEVNELSHWCISHKHLIDRHPFKELISLIESAYSDSHYYDLITSSLQFLSGLISACESGNGLNRFGVLIKIKRRMRGV